MKAASIRINNRGLIFELQISHLRQTPQKKTGDLSACESTYHVNDEVIVHLVAVFLQDGAEHLLDGATRPTPHPQRPARR